MLSDTIVAQATPLGRGGVSIIRISGPEAKKIGQRLTKKKLFIPRETYHRLIKGTGDLKVKIYKL